MADLTIHIPDKTVRIAGISLIAILLACGLSALWASGAFHSNYELKMFAPDRAGLRVGAPALLSGMTVGRVSRIELASGPPENNRSILVTLSIEKRSLTSIRSDSVAHLGRNGLLGDSFISIQRGAAGVPINPGGEIRFVPNRELSATDVMNIIAKIGDCVKENKDAASSNSQDSVEKSHTAQ